MTRARLAQHLDAISANLDRNRPTTLGNVRVQWTTDRRGLVAISPAGAVCGRVLKRDTETPTGAARRLIMSMIVRLED